jgi:outer membrane protein
LDTSEVMVLKQYFIGDSTENRFTDIREKDAIVAQRYIVAAGEARLQSYRLAYIPSLGLSAGWSAGKELSDAAGGSDDITTALQVGASLTIPLFDNKKRWAQVKNAELSLDNSRLKLEELQQSADFTITQAALEDAMAKDRITSNNARLATAQEALMAMEERYKVGASTLSELNTVQSNFMEAQSALVQSQFDRTISRITLLHETGRTDQIYKLLNIGLLEKRQ